MAVDLVAFSLQSQLGDYEADLHGDDYMDEFRFYPNQNKELEKEIKKRHKTLVGLNPAECEVNFLRIIKKLDFYGINLHNVICPNKMECQVGLTPKGITVVKDKEKMAFFFWPRISKLTFKKKHFILEVQEDQKQADVYHYLLPSAQAAKHLWKCAVEHHTFFRLIKPASKPKRTSSFLRFGSRFRYSGKTEYQTQKDARLSARKSMKFKRASSERFTKRSTIGYIRVGSRVWGKALNGDFYKGVVTGLGQMIHIKFDNGDTIAHDRNDPECVVFDKDPDANEIQIGTRVIAHWPTLPAYLSGKVIGMEHHKYYVEYDDGDKHHNSINQMRILKPPIFFGPGSDVRKVNLKKKSESMKVTSLTGKAVITTELPARKISDRTNGSLKGSETDGGSAVDIEASLSNDQKENKLPPRSQSFPGNVRVQRGETEGDMSSENDLKHPRNKSFAGTTKVQKPPMEIFSLPETDVDSGITVACESGKGSRRNVRTFDLTQADDKASKTNRSSLAGSRPEIVASRDAPYAPDFAEDNRGQQDAKFYNLDAQRAFHVIEAPANPDAANDDVTKRLSYVCGISSSQDALIDAAEKSEKENKRRSSLPDIRILEQILPQDGGADKETADSKKHTSSMNDLAKTSADNNMNSAPLHIDNLHVNTFIQQGHVVTHPTAVQKDHLVLVTDL